MFNQSISQTLKPLLSLTLSQKTEAMFLGTAIGDALGLAVETKTNSYILQTHGPFKDYLDPCHNEIWPKNSCKGTWSDDTQLSLALARALIKKGLDIDEIARQHVIAYEESTLGWGESTRKAIKAIKEGQNPKTASSTRGVGNGVVMKLPALAAYFELKGQSYLNHHEFIRELTFMTHATSLAFCASMAHLAALSYCLRTEPDKFSPDNCVNEILAATEYAQKICPATVGQDNIVDRLQRLREWRSYDSSKIISDFKGGCYVYESLPFSLMFFICNPYSLDSMFECIWAGGDTDSNGSIVGSLLGALHGSNFFPERLIAGLQKSELIIQTARDLSAS